jgi:hypothetical protein
MPRYCCTVNTLKFSTVIPISLLLGVQSFMKGAFIDIILETARQWDINYWVNRIFET